MRRCGRWAPPACGSCSGPGSRPTGSTSSACTAPTASMTERADPMAFAAEVPPQRASRVTRSDYTWGDDDWMAQRALTQSGVRADEHLRGAPDVVAAGPELSRTRHRTHRVRRRAGLHARRTAARRRAPVRRIVGLPGHVVLRADVAAGHARRLPVPGRRAASGRHRRHRRLGARPLPQGRVGARPVRRHPALRALRSAPRRATRLGHLRIRLRSARGTQLPGRQRAVLAAGVPHRRAAGGRRRVDALPGLLASSRRLDAQHPRRPGEPRGGAVPAGDERDRPQDRPRHRDHRRGVDVVARCHSPDEPWRTWFFDEVEHGLDERHAGVHQP